MKRLALALALLACTGCAKRLVGPEVRRADFWTQYNRWDWQHRTEAEFWEAHPRLWAEYASQIRVELK